MHQLCSRTPNICIDCQMLKKADLNITDFRPVLEDHSLSQDFREHIQQESIVNLHQE